MQSIIFSFDGILKELKKLNEALSESQSVSDNEQQKRSCDTCKYKDGFRCKHPENCECDELENWEQL